MSSIPLTKKPRAKPVYREQKSHHKPIATFLASTLGAGCWWSTFPSGGGGKLRGAILRGLGLKEGVPDILVIFNGSAYWLEVKASKGRLSDDQLICHAMLEMAGSKVAVVKTLDDTQAALERWGIPMRAKLVSPIHIRGT